MAEYKLIKTQDTNLIDTVYKKTGGLFIPFANDNTDYQEYLEWVAAGNTADAAD